MPVEIFNGAKVCPDKIGGIDVLRVSPTTPECPYWAFVVSGIYSEDSSKSGETTKHKYPTAIEASRGVARLRVAKCNNITVEAYAVGNWENFSILNH